MWWYIRYLHDNGYYCPLCPISLTTGSLSTMEGVTRRNMTTRSIPFIKYNTYVVYEIYMIRCEQKVYIQHIKLQAFGPTILKGVCFWTYNT